MNNDNNIKFWKYAVVGLVFLNLTVLAFMFLQNKHQPHFPPEMQGREIGGGPGEFICRELKFNPEQRKAFEMLRDNHRAAMDSLDQQSRTLHNDYFDLLKTENTDASKKNELAEAIALNQKSKELITFNHFAEVRKICDANQKEKFDEIIQDVLRQMHRGKDKPPHQP